MFCTAGSECHSGPSLWPFCVMVLDDVSDRNLKCSKLEQIPREFWACSISCWQQSHCPDCPLFLLHSSELNGSLSGKKRERESVYARQHVLWERTNYSDVPFHVCTLLSSTWAPVPVVHNRAQVWGDSAITNRERRGSERVLKDLHSTILPGNINNTNNMNIHAK